MRTRLTVLRLHLPLPALPVSVVTEGEDRPEAGEHHGVPAAKADHHDGVASRSRARDGGRDPPVSVVSVPELAELVVAPAPGLPGLVHHDHVARVLAAAHVPDPRALQRRQPHRLVDVVLGVVAVLLQLAGLQGLRTFMSNKIQLLGSPEHLCADRKYFSNSHFATPWCRRTASRRTRGLA